VIHKAAGATFHRGKYWRRFFYKSLFLSSVTNPPVVYACL